MNKEELSGKQLLWIIALVVVICVTNCEGTLNFSQNHDGQLKKTEIQAAVKGYLRENLHDWDSYKSLSWSEVEYLNPGYAIKHKYKATNAFGGYVTKTRLFYVNENGVVIYEEEL